MTIRIRQCQLNNVPMGPDVTVDVAAVVRFDARAYQAGGIATASYVSHWDLFAMGFTPPPFGDDVIRCWT